MFQSFLFSWSIKSGSRQCRSKTLRYSALGAGWGNPAGRAANVPHHNQRNRSPCRQVFQAEAAFFSLPLGFGSQATKLGQGSVDWVFSRQMVSGLPVPVALGQLTFSLCLKRSWVYFALGSIGWSSRNICRYINIYRAFLGQPVVLCQWLKNYVLPIIGPMTA